MFPVIEKYNSSGLSKVEFCKQRSIPIAVFWYWYRKHRDEVEQTEHHFVEVQPIALNSVKLEVEFGDLRLRFHELPPVEYLRGIAQIR